MLNRSITFFGLAFCAAVIFVSVVNNQTTSTLAYFSETSEFHRDMSGQNTLLSTKIQHHLSFVYKGNPLTVMVKDSKISCNGKEYKAVSGRTYKWKWFDPTFNQDQEMHITPYSDGSFLIQINSIGYKKKREDIIRMVYGIKNLTPADTLKPDTFSYNNTVAFVEPIPGVGRLVAWYDMRLEDEEDPDALYPSKAKWITYQYELFMSDGNKLSINCEKKHPADSPDREISKAVNINKMPEYYRNLITSLKVYRLTKL